MKQNFDYEDGFMGVRESKPATYFRSFQQDYRLRSLIQNIRFEKGKLLDVGCGGGLLTESLPYYYPNGKIFGCDVSKTAISYAKKLGSGKVEYGVIKNRIFPYKDNSFDVCICFDVLEHVPDVDFFLTEIKRVLKKNGKFFLIVPCEGERFTFSWLFQKIHMGQNLTFRYLGHIHPEFTHKSVYILLKKHDFIIKKMRYSEHVFYQTMLFCLVFSPKILLEKVFGEKIANEYTNSGLVRTPKNSKDPLFILRNSWYLLWDFMMYYPMNWETILFKNISPTAWKLHALAMKKSK